MGFSESSENALSTPRARSGRRLIPRLCGLLGGRGTTHFLYQDDEQGTDTRDVNHDFREGRCARLTSLYRALSERMSLSRAPGLPKKTLSLLIGVM